MADRYPDQGRGYESRGRNDGRSSRWGDDQGGRGRQFGQSRTSRFEDDDNDYARHFDQDRDESRGLGGYGGGYGQGISGQTYGGGYNDRRAEQGRDAQDWDRHDDQMWGRDYFQGQGSYAQDGEGYGQSFGQGGYAGGRSYSDQNFGQGSGRRGGTYGGQWGSSGYDEGDRASRAPGMGRQQGYLSRGGRQQWGQHAGRGPKNYTRSDDRIRDDINDRLTDDPELDATEIEVKVANCELTLSGTVDSRLAKRRAEDCADAISGVRHVQNNLRVQARSGPSGGEETTTRANKRGNKGDGDSTVQ